MLRLTRMPGWLTLLVAAAAVVGTARPADAKSYAADRFDVTARLLPDRSLSVEERIVFRFEGDYTYVFREIPQDRTDGLGDLEARLDGVRFPVGTGPGSIEVKTGRSVRVTWHFAAASGTHVFTLRYRLAGAAAQDGSGDLLAWNVLPREHAYRIREARAILQLPRGVRLASLPSVRPATVQVTIDYVPGAAVAERIVVGATDLGRNDSIRLDLRLASGAFTTDAPLWQHEAAERRRRGPLLLIPAGGVLVLGFGWLGAFWSAWRRSSRDAPSAPSPQPGPPDAQLPVAFTTRLAGGAARGPAAVVTMIDLAARGVIAIEEGPRARLRGRTFVARLAQQPPGLRPHETAWLEVAFGTSTPRVREVSLEKLQRRFGGGRNAFSRAVQQDMRHAGLVDPERLTARASLIRAAVIAAILAVVGIGVAVLLAQGFGAWVTVVPGSFALVALACAIAAGAFSTFTREGERLAQQWRTYFSTLRSLAKDKRAEPDAMAADWLPYAVAAGVGAAWVRKLVATPGRYDTPAWFHAAAETGDDHGAAFVAFVGTHASTSGGGAGVGGGSSGGAAGGGSSGAG